jgi:hypothetical protein
MRSWIAAATGFGAESQVSSAMLCSHSPSTLAGVHTAAKANGTPPSTVKWNGCGAPCPPRLRGPSGFSHSK